MPKVLRRGWNRSSTRKRTVGVKDYDTNGNIADGLKIRWIYRRVGTVSIGGGVSPCILRISGNNPGAPLVAATAATPGTYSTNYMQPYNYPEVYGRNANPGGTTQAAMPQRYSYGVCVGSTIDMKITPFADGDANLDDYKINMVVWCDRGQMTTAAATSFENIMAGNIKPKWVLRQRAALSPLMHFKKYLSTKTALVLNKKTDIFMMDDATNRPEFGHAGLDASGVPSTFPFDMYDQDRKWTWVVMLWAQKVSGAAAVTSANIELSVKYYDVAMRSAGPLLGFAPLFTGPDNVAFGIQPPGDLGVEDEPPTDDHDVEPVWDT